MEDKIHSKNQLKSNQFRESLKINEKKNNKY